MATTVARISAGDNGTVTRISMSAAGDSVRLKLRGYVNFLDRGVVFHFRPGSGASVDFKLSLLPHGPEYVEHSESPIRESCAVHQVTPFQSVMLEASGGSAEVDVLLPVYRSAELEVL